MAIERNAGSNGNFISEAGEYVVKVLETKTGTSKSGKPMLTVTFQTSDELLIRGYFVKSLTFHMKALEELKQASGMKITDSADNLVGREVGILVEAQKPDESGRVFMSVCGYGPKDKVTMAAVQASESSFSHAHEEVPF